MYIIYTNGLIVYHPRLCLDSALAGPFVNLGLSWPSAPKQFHTSGAMSLMPMGWRALIKLIEEVPAMFWPFLDSDTPPLYLQTSGDNNTSAPQPYRHFQGRRCCQSLAGFPLKAILHQINFSSILSKVLRSPCGIACMGRPAKMAWRRDAKGILVGLHFLLTSRWIALE